MSERGARVARGLTAACVATFVAALFHVAGGGSTPSVLALTLSLTFSGLAGIALIGKHRSLGRTAAAVIVSQLLFHGLFSLDPSGSGGFAGGSGHVHPGTRLLYVAGTDGPVSAGTDDMMMWISHAAAAIITIVALRHGERLLHSILTLLARTAITLGRLLWPLVPIRIERRLALHAFGAEPRTPLLLLLIGLLRHRGPPVAMGTPTL